MNPLGIGFLGAGTVAQLHADAIRQTPGVELLAVHDPDRERTDALAASYGAASAADVPSLIDHDGVDAVFVLTPTATHVPLARQCIDHGKHVLVEKPVADDPAVIRALAEHARSNDRVIVPGHNYLHLPECTRLIRQASEGQLGRIRALFVTYIIAHPERLAAQYSGVLAEVMVHHSYLALAILGVPDTVHGGTCTPGWETLTTDDQAWMTWEYSDGAIAQMFGSFAVDDLSETPVNFAIKALGTRGSATVNWHASSTLNGGSFRIGMPLYDETYRNQCAAFRDIVQAGAAPLSTLEDAANVADIITSVASLSSSARISSSAVFGNRMPEQT